MSSLAKECGGVSFLMGSLTPEGEVAAGVAGDAEVEAASA